MKTPPQDDEKWQALLAHSTPTFAGDAAPPYGFVTGTLARLRAERGEMDLFEKIGLRALFASLAMLVTIGGLTIGIQLQGRLDSDPSLKSIVQAEDIPIA